MDKCLLFLVLMKKTRNLSQRKRERKAKRKSLRGLDQLPVIPGKRIDFVACQNDLTRT